MKHYRTLLLISCSLLLFSSCETKTKFSIENNTNLLIDSIKISNGYDYIILNNIKDKETRLCSLSFTDKTPNYDGTLFIELYPSKRLEDFWYYSNGLQPDAHFFIDIQKDSIIFSKI